MVCSGCNPFEDACITLHPTFAPPWDVLSQSNRHLIGPEARAPTLCVCIHCFKLKLRDGLLHTLLYPIPKFCTWGSASSHRAKSDARESEVRAGKGRWTPVPTATRGEGRCPLLFLSHRSWRDWLTRTRGEILLARQSSLCLCPWAESRGNEALNNGGSRPSS